MSVCPICSAETSEGQRFCSKCGAGLETTTGQLPSGTILESRYKILETLGNGGMGTVYLAQDLRLNDSQVAVKEMKVKALSDEELEAAIKAFKKEAEMLIGLRNSALPRVIDFFSLGDRKWYLVMDYIQGETLKTVVQKCGPLSEAKVLNWAIELCNILKYLHYQDPPIIFRDLKPDNIMITSSGAIRLIDFGIARHFKIGMTKDTTAYGSIGFAAPEQYGQKQTDVRSDIYSLGATLHYLLTGVDPSTKPFTFELPSKSAKVSQKLEGVLMKALEIKPEDRHNTVEDMLDLISDAKNLSIEETFLLSAKDSHNFADVQTEVLGTSEKSLETSTKKVNKRIYITGAISSLLTILILLVVFLMLPEKEPNQTAKVKPATEKAEILKQDSKQTEKPKQKEQPRQTEQSEQTKTVQEQPKDDSEKQINEAPIERGFEYPAASNDSMNYVIQLSDEASERLLTEEELYNFSTWELTILRNGIYAMHGRAFVKDDIREFFEGQSWYAVNPYYSDSLLNDIEIKNAAMILKYQKKSGKILN